MNSIKKILAAAVIIIAIILFSSCYTVTEGHQALLLRLGQLQKNANTNQAKVMLPGLHFKIPFIETAQDFDTRLQTLDITSSRIVTAEKKYVIVDYYVKWRITNLEKFYTSTSGDYQQAGNLLQQQLNDILRAQFGQKTIAEVVSQDRLQIMAELLKQANNGTNSLGIEVTDVRIKQIDLPETVTNTVYQQMQAERERVATQHRSQGQATANALRAQADANVSITIAKAEEAAAQLKANGNATAAKIYADAYNQDPQFYAFYRSMLAYQAAFASKDDILILRPNSEFFKYFNEVGSAPAATLPTQVKQ